LRGNEFDSGGYPGFTVRKKVNCNLKEVEFEPFNPIEFDGFKIRIRNNLPLSAPKWSVVVF